VLIWVKLRIQSESIKVKTGTCNFKKISQSQSVEHMAFTQHQTQVPQERCRRTFSNDQQPLYHLSANHQPRPHDPHPYYTHRHQEPHRRPLGRTYPRPRSVSVIQSRPITPLISFGCLVFISPTYRYEPQQQLPHTQPHEREDN
jgi:hypothetical protein